MLRVHRKLAKGMELLDYYTNNEWQFDNTNALKIYGMVNKVESKVYQVHLTDFNDEKANQFFENGVLGARRYLLNQPDEALPSARRMLIM
jgi:alcohol-forming fatty acyl-CoA reductase